MALTPRLTQALPTTVPYAVNCLGFSPSGALVAAGGSEREEKGRGFDGAIRIYEVASGKQLKVLSGHGQATEGVYWISEDELVSWGNQELPKEGNGPPRGQRIRVWNLADATMSREVDLDQRFPSAVLFRIRQLEYQLYWSCNDGLMLWRGKKLEWMLRGGPRVRAISSDGASVLYQDGDQYCLYEVQSRRRRDLRELKVDWVAPLPQSGWLTYQNGVGYQRCAPDLSPVGQPLAGSTPWAYDCSDSRLSVVPGGGVLRFEGTLAPPQIRAFTLPTVEALVTALHPVTGKLVCASSKGLHWQSWIPA